MQDGTTGTSSQTGMVNVVSWKNPRHPVAHNTNAAGEGTIALQGIGRYLAPFCSRGRREPERPLPA